MAETMEPNLIKCSRCRCRMLERFYSVHPKTDIRYKLCDVCRKKAVLKKCEHGRRKAQCKQCVGSGICEHGREKAKCKQCGGSDICEHGRQKAQCIQCGGSALCEHDRQKAQCKLCSEILKCSSENCDYETASKTNLARHIKTCTNGRVGSSGEVSIKNTLEQMGIDYDYDTPYKVKSEKALLRWDFIITGWNHSGLNDDPLFIEYDGKQHFEAIKSWGGVEKLQKTQEYDKIKDDFCNDNNLLLLRIPYTEYENIKTHIAVFMRSHTNWGIE
jgi:hypothetical protein